MPTYEYACSSCQHEWEIEQSIKDDAITECPSCHKATAKRQISRGGGFILKGSGWYADLYSSPSNKKDESKKGDDGPSASTSTTTPSTTPSTSPASSDTSSTSSGTSSPTPGKGSAAPAT